MRKQSIESKLSEREKRLRKVQRIKDLIRRDEYDVERKFVAALDIIIQKMD